MFLPNDYRVQIALSISSEGLFENGSNFFENLE
jgi:hypothetical protein